MFVRRPHESNTRKPLPVSAWCIPGYGGKAFRLDSMTQEAL